MASTNFGVPSELDSEALANALKEAHSKGEELAKIDDSDFTDDQLAEFEAVAEFISNAKDEEQKRAEAEKKKAERIASLRDTVTVKKDDDDEDKPEGEADVEVVDEDGDKTEVKVDEDEDEDKKKPFASDSDGGEDEDNKKTSEDKAFADTEEEAPAEQEQAEAPTEEALAETPTEKSDEDDNEEEETADVSDNAKASLANAAKHAPKQESVQETSSKFSLTAAANVQGVPAGKQYANLSEASETIGNQLKQLPSSGRGRTKLPALQFSLEGEHVQGVTGNDSETLLAAGSEARLKEGSLVASGGWAAPSEQLLDFCAIETAEGLIDLPSITVKRGGVNYTKGPSFEDVLNSETGFWDMTEAEAEAGSVEKTAIEPAVPEFTDVRLDAVGAMVEAGLLTRHGWPELVERYAKLTVLAHQVKVHHKLIKGITDYTGDAVDVASGYGNAIDVLNIIDVVIAGERQRFSMGNNATVETLLPVWVRNVLRADLANRAGVDLLDITDARINAWFSARGARVQWLAQWQNLSYDGGIAQGYPETLEVIVYPAGTFVKGEEDVITLDTIYDSVNLKKNKYVHLFMEQGILVANPCYSGRRFQFPLNINGRTAANDITTDFGGGTGGGDAGGTE